MMLIVLFRINSASEEALEREEAIFNELSDSLLAHANEIKQCAHIIAILDVSSSLGTFSIILPCIFVY